MPADSSIFREEALEAHESGHSGGDLLRLHPSWVDTTYRLLLAAAAFALVFAALGAIGEHSAGPAVVRLEGRTGVHATTAGVVTALAVAPGETVTAGQVLLHLDDEASRADRDRLSRAVDQALADFLRDPADEGARTALASLRADRDRALATLEGRAVRAPADGVVGDLLVRPGQRLQPGDPVGSVLAPEGGVVLTALLPGHSQPQLQPGMALGLELGGYGSRRHAATIETVGQAVLGPQQATLHLDPELRDAVQVTGPVVVVQARLPTASFVENSREYAYSHGMTGRAEVRLRSRSILTTLVPGLDRLVGGLRGR